MKNTPHINPTAEIAETVLMPGDPLRAKYIADNFLTNVKQFNSIRNILGYTGVYKGKSISVMASGMGMPSMGIYSYELINFFGVKNLIRVGTCGGLSKNVKVYDIILAMGSCTDSNYPHYFGISGSVSAIPSWNLLNISYHIAKEKKLSLHVGNVLSSDIFYREYSMSNWIELGVIAVEMESAALYINAARYKANALCILTVSDHVVTHETTTAEERQNSFNSMIELALETSKEI